MRTQESKHIFSGAITLYGGRMSEFIANQHEAVSELPACLSVPPGVTEVYTRHRFAPGGLLLGISHDLNAGNSVT